MVQERFVVVLPVALKRRLKDRSRDLGMSMKSLLIFCLEQELGEGWRDETTPRLPGEQRIFPGGEL